MPLFLQYVPPPLVERADFGGVSLQKGLQGNPFVNGFLCLVFGEHDDAAARGLFADDGIIRTHLRDTPMERVIKIIFGERMYACQMPDSLMHVFNVFALRSCFQYRSAAIGAPKGKRRGAHECMRT